MKKPAQKTIRRMRSVQVHDLASVSGGDNGVIHMETLTGGASPDDNGVIHIQNAIDPLENGVIHMQ